MGSPKIRAVKKEQKLYLWDWAAISKRGPRFENMIAVHLLKHCCFLQDTEGRDVELRYFRDTDGREVDFVLLENQKPRLLVEAKLSEQEISPHLKYLKNKFPEAEAWQIYLGSGEDSLSKEGIRLASAQLLLKDLST